ncbi:MAG: ABC transporter permease [Chloroflexaceae bacterium]|nr:ABC transporter permease [Chloroflexaceae bacterium]
MLLELYKHRRYIWNNACNELRYRYAGTGLGALWNILNPLFEIVVYGGVFSLIFPTGVRGGSYLVFLIAGWIPWRTFLDAISQGSNAFVENTNYLKRLAIPTEVFVARSAMLSMLLLAIYLLLLLPITAVIEQLSIGWHLLGLPLLGLMLQSLGFGLALILAHFRALFPDIKELLNKALSLWRWTLPIIYPDTIVPEHLRPWFYLNPPYAFIESIRNLILDQALPTFWQWATMLLWLTVILGLGFIINRNLQFEVRDYL